MEIVTEEVGTPRNDGSPGSALYRVPIRLSRRPPREWADIFVQIWDRPPRFTTMHRPGTAIVSDDKVILNSTTLEEIEKYHRDTLLLVVDETNKKYAEFLTAADEASKKEEERVQQHREEVRKKAGNIRFEDKDDKNL